MARKAADPFGRRKSAVEQAETFAPEDPRLATSLNNLAMIYHVQGKYTEAEQLYKCAIGVHEKALGPDDLDLATTLENYADLLRNMNREVQAFQMEARAKAIRGKAAK